MPYFLVVYSPFSYLCTPFIQKGILLRDGVAKKNIYEQITFYNQTCERGCRKA